MTSAPAELLPDHEAAKREAHWLSTPEPGDYVSADILNLARAYLDLASRAMRTPAGQGEAIGLLRSIIERFDTADHGATAIISEELIEKARAVTQREEKRND